MMKLPLMRPVELTLDAVYITPLGHRCRLQQRKTEGDHFTFVYISRSGGFMLSPSNVCILRREW